MSSKLSDDVNSPYNTSPPSTCQIVLGANLTRVTIELNSSLTLSGKANFSALYYFQIQYAARCALVAIPYEKNVCYIIDLSGNSGTNFLSTYDENPQVTIGGGYVNFTKSAWSATFTVTNKLTQGTDFYYKRLC